MIVAFIYLLSIHLAKRFWPYGYGSLAGEHLDLML